MREGSHRDPPAGGSGPSRGGWLSIWCQRHPDHVSARVMSAAIGTVWLATFIGSTYHYRALPMGGESVEPYALDVGALDPATRDQARKLGSEIRRLRSRIQSFRPRGIYIVVDTSRNRLYVKKAERTLLEASCSTGSGLLLRDPTTDRQWIFDTPRGLFHVRRKASDPVWTKPDWAFIEEGRPVPERWRERLDEDTLGEYALYFGDGYMIHGTLYQRYLGRSITHGCVRLGDDDLKRVYGLTPVGAAIYIF